jgi:hypothetical protein
MTPEVEEVLADPHVARALALAGAEVGEAVLDWNPLAELRPALDGALARAEFDEERLVGMDGNAARGRRGALRAPRARLAGGRREARDGARDERDRRAGGAGDAGRIEVEREVGLGEATAIAKREGRAMDPHAGATTLGDSGGGEIPSVDVTVLDGEALLLHAREQVGGRFAFGPIAGSHRRRDNQAGVEVESEVAFETVEARRFTLGPCRMSPSRMLIRRSLLTP